MHSLILTNATFTNGYSTYTLDILSLAAILCAIIVIISKNPIVSVLFLIGLFMSIACYLITLGLCFIGLSYLLVYVGAVSILFLFILMLLNIRISELSSHTSNSIPLAIFIAILFSLLVDQVLPYNGITIDVFNTLAVYLKIIIAAFIYSYSFISTSYISIQEWHFEYIKAELLTFIKLYCNNDELFFVSSYLWDGFLSENSHITSIGNIMYTSYFIWLIIISIILLLSMVGVIVILIKQKK